MADPGIYLVNSTGEMSALATESGDGDRNLLHEALDELGIQHPSHGCDVCDFTGQESHQCCPDCTLGTVRSIENL